MLSIPQTVLEIRITRILCPTDFFFVRQRGSAGRLLFRTGRADKLVKMRETHRK